MAFRFLKASMRLSGILCFSVLPGSAMQVRMKKALAAQIVRQWH